jgi:hypothetical protein
MFKFGEDVGEKKDDGVSDNEDDVRFVTLKE